MSTHDDLVRYGFARQGDTRPSCMYDGYWTPWHIAADRIAELQAENAKLRAVVEAAKVYIASLQSNSHHGKSHWDAAIDALEQP